ncbi:hypothetical protein INQ20_27545, partial [Escherichia coli]|nr:hypothetical protein [Escherichia coli]
RCALAGAGGDPAQRVVGGGGGQQFPVDPLPPGPLAAAAVTTPGADALPDRDTGDGQPDRGVNPPAVRPHGSDRQPKQNRGGLS